MASQTQPTLTNISLHEADHGYIITITTLTNVFPQPTKNIVFMNLNKALKHYKALMLEKENTSDLQDIAVGPLSDSAENSTISH